MVLGVGSSKGAEEAHLVRARVWVRVRVKGEGEGAAEGEGEGSTSELGAPLPAR